MNGNIFFCLQAIGLYVTGKRSWRVLKRRMNLETRKYKEREREKSSPLGLG
jgi:hypothetical protein